MKANSFILKAVFAVALFASLTANASLIVNGSFENLAFAGSATKKGQVKGLSLEDFANKNKAWDVYTQLPGWVTVHGEGMELQKNVVSKSQDGRHHLELDSHPRNGSNSVIAQQLDNLVVGDKYLLEFFYKPRTNRKNDNGIEAFWFDGAMNFDTSMDAVFSVDLTRSQSRTWQKQTVLLTASSSSMSLGFGAFGTQNTLGGLIDNVSMIHIGGNGQVAAKVTEPSTLLILVGGFLVAFGMRRKNVK